jgi:hypothetical protein
MNVKITYMGFDLYQLLTTVISGPTNLNVSEHGEMLWHHML